MNTSRLFYLGFAFLLSSIAFIGQAQTTCPAVTNLVTTPVSFSSVSVNATPAAGATSYIIVCTIYPNAASVGILFNSVSVTTPAYTFTGLPAGTSYVICVNAICVPGQQQGSACSPRTVLLATHNAALAEQVAFSPNPAHHTTTLTLPAQLSRGTSATLFNSLGQVVRQHLLPAGPTATLDLVGLALGVYSVKLQAGDEWVTKRLVVQ